ncbi:ribosome maturation factor RimM [Thermosulfuriphilus sp.]
MGKTGLLPLGRIVRAHGLGGEVKVLAYVIDQEDLLQLERFFICQNGKLKELLVEKGRFAPGRRGLLLKFKGIEDREAAESLVGKEILYPQSDLPPPEEGKFYIHQLLGLEVFLDTGERLGLLKAVWPIGPYDLYVVRTEKGKEYLIPAIKEIVLEIDLTAKKMRISPPPGLLETQE